VNDDMPRKLPRYVYNERNSSGTNRYYFRRDKQSPRVRLPEFGSDEFEQAYHEALTGSAMPQKAKPGAGSLSWLIRQYRLSSAYLALSDATRRQRDNIFKHVEENAGDKPYKAITRKIIIASREERAETPAQARNFLDAMRGLFRWALESELIAVDPTAGVKNPARPKSAGFPIWTDAEVEAYRETWPLGTHERVWLEVLIGTGARRGDAVIMGRQHVKDGMIGLETQKESVWAYVPILASMQEAIDTGPTGDLTFIVGKTGRNLTKESFGNFFRAACNAAGVKKSAHGLRKYAATAYAEQGLSEGELESIFGWVRGSSMAAHYSKNAERQKIARGAAEKIRNSVSPQVNGISPQAKKVVE
jgi:integrase